MRRRDGVLLDLHPRPLAAGDVEAAAAALGRPHRVEGVVVRGDQRGRELGFPTANLESPPHAAIPADGVYAGWLMTGPADRHGGARWPAAISIGTNPTFEGAERTVEAYVLDRDDLDLYGEHVARGLRRAAARDTSSSTPRDAHRADARDVDRPRETSRACSLTCDRGEHPPDRCGAAPGDGRG